ncbi:MAG: 3-phosphoshikimate 1-carboxyvinyltransferase [Planctomycetota bacterium]|jgi:3-phosphoshikimate 1-carboxyvinyltransferase|nr:3-phosphoshikimate 1-carboxyvinyltransferase [Planctomycetota bacterium]
MSKTDQPVTRKNQVQLKPLTREPQFSLAVPGSKSIANRALLLAGFAQGCSRLAAVPESDDTAHAIAALQSLGVACQRENGVVEVMGHGLALPVSSGEVAIGSSGTVGRFLPGLLAAAPKGDWCLTASPQLASRPLAPLLAALQGLGGTLEGSPDGASFPLRVKGGGLAGGEVTLSARDSSQFASGVLLAAPLAREAVVVNITDLDPEEAYINITLAMLSRFGVTYASQPGPDCLRVAFPAPQAYQPVNFPVEADSNSAMYFLVLPLVVGGQAEINNLNPASGQPGLRFLEIIQRLGGKVLAGPDRVTVSRDKAPLAGGFTVDMRSRSEMALTLGVLAVFADAPITMTNLAHIRGHESDRLAVLAHTLAAVGVKTEAGDDWIRIHPLARDKILNTLVDSHNDHRLAMSFAILGLAANGITIQGPEAVNKTFPGFFPLLASIGAEVSFL